MRIRSTKPEFWRSARIAGVDWDARLVLKGLESYVDDNGVGRDDLALIVSDVFPRDLIREPSRTLARVSEAISALSEAGLVHRYEAEGTPVLYLAFWESVQRVDKPAKGRFSRPDGTKEYGESQIRESVASPREMSRDVAPGTGEQGNRGTGEQGNSSNAPPKIAAEPDRFNEFWMAYPRKDDKAKAQTAYRSARKRAAQADIIAGAQRYAADPNREQGFTKIPTSWLNAGSWANGPLPNRNGAARPNAATERNNASEAQVRRLMEQQNANAQFAIGPGQ